MCGKRTLPDVPTLLASNKQGQIPQLFPFWKKFRFWVIEDNWDDYRWDFRENRVQQSTVFLYPLQENHRKNTRRVQKSMRTQLQREKVVTHSQCLETSNLMSLFYARPSPCCQSELSPRRRCSVGKIYHRKAYQIHRYRWEAWRARALPPR